MTRIDFYVLDEGARQDRRHLACILAGKAWRQGQRVYIHVPTEQEAELLDELMWTFRDTSFLPHERLGGRLADEAQVLIGWGEHRPPPDGTVMINLEHPTPPFFSQFERVIEIVDHDPAIREQARARWRYYQDRGYAMTKHDIAPGYD